MKRFVLIFCWIAGLFSCGYAATPNEVTVLTSGYQTLDVENATYILTTNGKPVNARLVVKASAKLILQDCHLLRTSSGYPILIEGAGIRLEIQMSGANSICTNYNKDNTLAMPVIYADADNAPEIIFSECSEAPSGSELLLRGSSTSTAIVPPIQLNGAGSVTFRSGYVRIATSSGKPTTGNYWVPSLVSANTVILRGGTVTAQMCPKENLAITGNLLVEKESTGSNYLKRVNTLFDSKNVFMSGGILTTAGELCTATLHTLKPETEAYDTFYAYSAPAMQYPFSASASTTITGGIIRGSTIFVCYGLPANTTIPATNFTHTGTDAFKDVVTDENGVVTLANASAYPNLQLNFVDEKVKAMAEVFQTAVMPSADGCTVEALFGISDITLDAETLQPTLRIELDLPNEPATVLSKTINVRVWCHVDGGEALLVAEETLLFTRSSNDQSFTASVLCWDLETEGTTAKYVIEAYN